MSGPETRQTGGRRVRPAKTGSNTLGAKRRADMSGGQTRAKTGSEKELGSQCSFLVIPIMCNFGK